MLESCFFIHSFSGLGVFPRVRPGGDGGVRVLLGGEETAGLAQSVAPELFPRASAENISSTASSKLIKESTEGAALNLIIAESAECIYALSRVW